jgi:hypothetical protein
MYDRNLLPASSGFASVLEDGGNRLLQYLVNFYKTASRHVVKDVKISAHISFIQGETYFGIVLSVIIASYKNITGL